MSDTRTVCIAAGGTAGHINPALALAEELRDRGCRVVFVGQERKLEGRLVPEAGFELVPITVTGLDRSRPWTAFSALWRVRRAQGMLAKHFERTGRPDVAIGFGAYVEVPLLNWCKSAHVPYLLHEQNSVPGLANKMMSAHAERVCISVPAAEAAFKREGDPDHVHLTGNPVRKSILAGSRERGRAALGIPADAVLLLVFGGSLGAQHINEEMVRLRDRLLAIDNLYVVHSTGADGFDETSSALALDKAAAERYRVCPYIENMGDMLAASDLVLSRSGASSVAEIAALAVPSVLVPYPFATADHQTTNARFLTDAHAALLFKDDELVGDAFESELLALLGDPARRERMRAAAAGLGQDRAAALLADEVLGCI